MFKIYILAFILTCAHAQINFTSISCDRRPKIIGGLEAEKHEMPYIVSLTRRGGHFCGATIINERWLLTAGHCICDGLNKVMKATQIQGVLGLHSISEYQNGIESFESATAIPMKVHFKQIIPHPKYVCNNIMNDIALLELVYPIKFSDAIKPICLAVDNNDGDFENELATVSGWGWTDENQEDGQRADILRKASVKIWNNKACEQSYQMNGRPNNVIDETQLCAGFKSGGIDSCWADSGGPLISQEKHLIGVVSTGIGCGRPGLPGIYTRVSKYIKWITTVIN